MKPSQLVVALAFGIVGLASLTGAASAATAHASDPISIFAGPNTFNPILGRLAAGEEVTIDRCTASGKWCRVFHDGPTGWVPASYLIGSAAKNDATPLQSLTSPPVDQQNDLDHTKRGF